MEVACFLELRTFRRKVIKFFIKPYLFRAFVESLVVKLTSVDNKRMEFGIDEIVAVKELIYETLIGEELAPRNFAPFHLSVREFRQPGIL